MQKPKILMIIERYLPGVRSGGPIRTAASVVEKIGDQFDFYILTSDRDNGDSRPYPNVKQDDWNEVGRAHVYYASNLSAGTIAKVAKDLRPEAIYLTGFWSITSIYALILRRLRNLGSVPVMLAPRGDLGPGALTIRSLKKKLFRTFANAIGLYRNLEWHCSSEREKREVVYALSPLVPDIEAHTYIAPDLNSLPESSDEQKVAKKKGTCQFIFLARLCRLKNLSFIIDRLCDVTGDITLNVFGYLDDERYWRECQEKAARLPSNVKFNYRGFVSPEQVQRVFAEHHFFVSPTLGENFGHVIVEAGSAGVPVIISDRTQWLGLERLGVGWDLPLEDTETWKRVLQACVEMDDPEYQGLKERAREWGQRSLSSPEAVSQNVTLFRSIGQSSS